MRSDNTDCDVVLIVVREPRKECGVVYAHVEGFRMHSMTVILGFSIGRLNLSNSGEEFKCRISIKVHGRFRLTTESDDLFWVSSSR